MSGLTLPDHLAQALRSSDHRIIVTGAGGWIGSATLHMLRQALGPEAFRQRVSAFASRGHSLRLTDGADVPLLSLEALGNIDGRPGLLLHYAFLGKERAGEIPLADYVAANARITDAVRRAVERLKPASMFLTSSGAVYRPDRSIDDDLATNPYGVLKHRDEVAFAEACGAAGTYLVTARVFNLSGEHINKLGSYALSSFILDALAGRPIAIRATRRVERSYVYVGDVITLALACLLDRDPAPPVFDTAGERVVEVGELAVLVRELCGRPDLPVSRAPLDASLPADRYVGDGRAMRTLAAGRGLALQDLRTQLSLTIAHLAQMRLEVAG